MSYEYDVIILGSGPAGFACAMQASKFDKKALVIEASSENLGGSWIHTGTVPSKALREAARVIKKYQEQFGKSNVKPWEKYKMADLLHYKNKILSVKNSKVVKDLQKNEVEVKRGFGRILDEHTIEITKAGGSKKTYTTEFIFVATGSHPVHPEHFELDHKKILDYNSILNLTHIPHRLVIVGGGANALEYATTFSALGTRVSILNERDDFLPFLDEEIKEYLFAILEAEGVELLNGVDKIHIQDNEIRNSTEVRFSLKGSDRLHVIETGQILYIGGKIPNTRGIGLENIEITLSPEGFLKVDENFKTEVDSLYAGGDVIGFPRLASVSFTQGRIAACRMFGIKALQMPPKMPFGIYSIPEISNIGLTENEAIEQGLDVTVGRAYYENITQADVSNQQKGLLKLVFETKTFKLLGVHIIGERASDLVHLGQVLIHHEGDIRYFIDNVLNYPTYSEAYRIAAFNGINRVYKAGVKYKKLLK